MEKDIQDQINFQKTKLISLIQLLVTTQSLQDERELNNKIQQVNEYLNSLLDKKQNLLSQKPNINNEIYTNPIKLEQQEINIDEYRFSTINVKFCKVTGITTIVQCKPSEKISDVIIRYRLKANDFDQNRFDYNLFDLNKKLDCTLFECGIKNSEHIIVSNLRNVVGKKS